MQRLVHGHTDGRPHRRCEDQRRQRRHGWHRVRQRRDSRHRRGAAAV